MICPDCNFKMYVEAKGVYVCESCGEVVGEKECVGGCAL